MKLGTLLLRNAAISLTQLEAGLRAQVLYGGRLGTNLVELGFLDVDGLGGYLAELSGLPVATQHLLDAVQPATLRLVGAELADLHGAIPLYVDDAGVLAIAMVDPFDEHARAALADAAGRPLLPHVVAELRLLYYLEKHYGIARKARYVRPGTRRTLAQADDRRRSQPAGGLVLPPQVRLEPRRRRISAPQAAAAPPPAAAHRAPTLLPYPTACDRVDGAPHRDQIAEALCEFAAGRFEALVVFLIRDGNALGWRGHVATPAGLAQPLEALSLPLGGTSALQAAHDTLRPFRGASPSAGRPTETALWQALGAEPPAELLVTPIIVKQRCVNLIYAHALGGGPLPDDATAEICELAVRASTAYVRLIRQSKHTLTTA